ncbi:MAG: hypothetical protein JNK76_13355 [Planctomycetales bacterium]|nr:hypothetical protein [Planctomycetales bacterium]MBN8624942.1 hypothetical protein [Planctomycetota bacterium]
MATAICRWAAIVLFVGLAGVRSLEAAEPAVDLHEAIAAGTVEAKVIARDAYHLRVFLKNPAKTPLTVEIPPVLAARPVLAQAVLAQQNFFNPGGQNGSSIFGQGQQSNNNQTQAVSGGAPFMSLSSSMNSSGQGPNNQPGGAVFAIPPESVREFRVGTVCVEHGKPNPRSIIKYELVRPEEVGVGPELQEVLIAARGGKLDRDVVQAAAWHLANDKTWDELGKMSTWVALNARAPIFKSSELAAAKQLVAAAEKRVASRSTSERRAKVAAIETPADDLALPVSARKRL